MGCVQYNEKVDVANIEHSYSDGNPSYLTVVAICQKPQTYVNYSDVSYSSINADWHSYFSYIKHCIINIANNHKNKAHRENWNGTHFHFIC